LLAQTRSLRYLNAQGLGFKGRELEPLTSLPNLECLSIGGGGPVWEQHGEETALAIARLPSLRRLWVLHCGITDSQLAHLKKLKRLAYLNLSQCKKLTDGCVRHLRDMRSLKHVDLWTTQISKQAKDALRKARPDLKVVP
jgi:hypothetical protein